MYEISVDNFLGFFKWLLVLVHYIKECTAKEKILEIFPLLRKSNSVNRKSHPALLLLVEVIPLFPLRKMVLSTT